MAASIPLKLDRESFLEEPDTDAVRHAAERYLCDVLNRFPSHLYPTADGPVELPPLDTDSIGRGIKHVLYGFLRLECLCPHGRLGLGVCHNPRRNKVFAKERRGAVYCDENCSKKHRSLTYYRDVGRAKRQARLYHGRPV